MLELLFYYGKGKVGVKPPVSTHDKKKELIQLDATEIVEQDIPRITYSDTQRLEMQRCNRKIFQSMGLLFQKHQTEREQHNIEERKYAIFSSYMQKCCNSECIGRNQNLIGCTQCMLRSLGWNYFKLDETITYTSPIGLVINTSKDFHSAIPQTIHQPIFNASKEEVEAFFYFHREYIRINRKNPVHKIFFNLIRYSWPLHLIHYQIAHRLLLLYHSAEIIIQNSENLNKQLNEYERVRKNMLFEKFGMKQLEYYGIPVEAVENSFIDSVACHNRLFKEASKDKTPFAKLVRTFLHISNGDLKIVKQFAVLLAKIFMGRPYLDFIDNNSKKLTVIITNNTMYIKQFLRNILTYNFKIGRLANFNSQNEDYAVKTNGTYYHFTEYSADQLSNKDYINEFIKDKRMGNIVNIDITKTKMTQEFKSLVEGKTVSIIDQYFGKLSLKSNAHYIRINNQLNDFNLNDYEISYEGIFCDDNLSNAVYDNLDQYELFFMLTGFVNYGIDLMTRSEAEDNNPVLSVIEAVNQFIDEMCEDTSTTIEIPPEISQISYEKERFDKVKPLGIEKLPFTHVDTFVEKFNEWCGVFYPNANYDKTNIKKELTNRFTRALYYKEKINGKDARGFYGLKLNFDGIEKTKKIKLAKIEASKMSAQDFVNEMQNIFNTYWIGEEDWPIKAKGY